LRSVCGNDLSGPLLLLSGASFVGCALRVADLFFAMVQLEV